MVRLHFGEENHPNHQGDDIEGQPRNSTAGRGMSVGRSKSIVSLTALEGMDEYTALSNYIQRYRDPRSASSSDPHADAADAGKGKSWWQFWRSGTSPKAQPQDAGVVPTEWLDTDIRQGLGVTDVDNRRKRYGFNELTAEKQNWIKQFLGYFTGPILYGRCLVRFPDQSQLTRVSHGNCSSVGRRSPGLGRFRCHLRYLDAQRHRRLVPGKAGRRCRR